MLKTRRTLSTKREREALVGILIQSTCLHAGVPLGLPRRGSVEQQQSPWLCRHPLLQRWRSWHPCAISSCSRWPTATRSFRAGGTASWEMAPSRRRPSRFAPGRGVPSQATHWDPLAQWVRALEQIESPLPAPISCYLLLSRHRHCIDELPRRTIESARCCCSWLRFRFRVASSNG